MQLQIYSEDVDQHRHFETRQHAWEVERRHLQMQINRERAAAQNKKRMEAEAAKIRRARLAAAWKVTDELTRGYEHEQLGVAKEEQSTRNVADVTTGMTQALLHEGRMKHTLGSYERLKQADKAAGALAERQGQQSWRIGMERGAREVGLEKKEESRDRVNAVRGFRWAKEDEKRQMKLDATTGSTRLVASRMVETRLPTAPVASGHAMSPGTWRPDSQTVAPGAWRTSQVDAQVQRARSTERLHHHKRLLAQTQRITAKTHTLDKWVASGQNVSSARYRAWRLKVDATKPPSTFKWPDSATHRRSTPVPPSAPSSPRAMSPVSPRPRSARPQSAR